MRTFLVLFTNPINLKVRDVIDKDTNCLLDKQALNRKFNINLNYVQFLI